MIESRKPRINGETMYYKYLNDSSVIGRTMKKTAIKGSQNPEFLKDVIKNDPDIEIQKLAQEVLNGLDNSLKFLFDD
jgi:hypothetical protein